MDRKILSAEILKSGYGTYLYHAKYTGEWSDMDLITAIDNHKYDNPTTKDLTINHYGGEVSRISDNEALVYIYYD